MWILIIYVIGSIVALAFSVRTVVKSDGRLELGTLAILIGLSIFSWIWFIIAISVFYSDYVIYEKKK